jgi:peptidoglycan hydrolase CwlO-like protein
MDADSEQVFHDLEQRHLLLKKEHDLVCAERNALKGANRWLVAIRLHNNSTPRISTYSEYHVSTEKLASIQTSTDDFHQKLNSAHKDVQDKDFELKQLQRKTKNLEDSIEDLQDRYRRRSEECDR